MAGPAPTFDEIWVQAGKYVGLWEHWDNIHNAAATNTLDEYDDILQGVGEGTYTPDALLLTRADLGAAAKPLARPALAERWRPFLREMVALIAGDAPSPGLGSANLLAVIRRHMVDNSLSIKTRAMTLSAPAAVGVPAGNGTIRRLTEDRDGFTIESANPELLTFEVIADQNSTAREHAELFRVTGLTPRQVGANNALGWLGSGIDTTLESAHARSSTIIRNSSFDTNAIASNGDLLTAVGDVSSWVVATPANWRAYSDATAVYRGFPGAPATKWGLENLANDSITQSILEVNQGASFNPDVPYFLRVAWKRKATSTGNVTLNLGASSATASIAAAPSATWQHLFIPLDAAAWLDVFNQVPLSVSVVFDTRAGDGVAIDDVVLVSAARIGGSWYVSDGGDTAWERKDKWTANTVDGPRAKFAYWLWRAFASDGWLPTAAVPTQPDP